MEIIDKYANDFLSVKERAENDLPLPDRLYIDDIAMLWYPDNEAMRSAVMKSMTKAFLAGDLIGTEQKRPQPTDYLLEFNRLSLHAHYQLMGGINCNLLFIVSDFIKWLELNNYKQRKSHKCLLNKWLSIKTSKENGHHVPEIRRKRKDVLIERNESLRMIGKFLTAKGIDYFDEFHSAEAWRLIVSGEYKDPEMTISIGESKKLIFVNGEKVLRENFLEQIRKRFETEKEALKRLFPEIPGNSGN